ncbi:unnamed protein product [Linum trigynum]|uniref:Uncharacterized protein n=1 Tax=Linum trigynum TaxID=586398 RepID=A0AAV2CPH9_9ROSI
MEPSKDVLDKERTVSDSAILSEIDRTMKRHTDNMLIILEGVSSRLIQLESRTRNLESSVDDLKVSVGNNHGSTDGKMRQLENILREVQTGVQAVKDKQELLESQLHLQNLHVSNVNQHQQEPQNTGQAANVVQQQALSASAPPQSHHQHASPQLTSFPQSLPSVPGLPPPTVPLPQPQSLPPVTPLPYYVPAGHTHEPPPNPQYQGGPPQQASPVAAPPPPHQLYQSAPPQYPQQQPQIPQQPQQPAGHHFDEASYLASQSYPPTTTAISAIWWWSLPAPAVLRHSSSLYWVQSSSIRIHGDVPLQWRRQHNGETTATSICLYASLIIVENILILRA